MSKFVHLHVHSDFSVKDAMSRPHDMAKRLHEIDQTAIALTDHGSLSGIAVFDKDLKKDGIKLIAGWEAYVAQISADDTSSRDTCHLTLLAMNMEGVHNLYKLHTLSWQRPAYYFDPRTDFDLIGEHSAGLIALSGCLGGALLKPLHQGNTKRALENLKKLKQIFGKRFFLELQDHQIDKDGPSIEWLAEQAEQFNLPLVATNDAHYVNKVDWKPHDRLVACGMGQQVDNPNRAISYVPEEFYLKSYREMAERFDKIELVMSAKIADMCEPLALESKVFHIPTYFPRPKNTIEKLYAGKQRFVERFG